MAQHLIIHSLVRSLNGDDLVKILSVCGATEGEIKGFLQLTSWESHTKTFYDLQYRPLIKKGTKYMLLPGVFASSNIFRNVQVSNRLRPKDQSKKFVQLCKVLFENRFKRVVCENEVQAGGESTEIDITVVQEKTLYLFECKYSVPPCDSHELRDIWKDIQKGIQQQCLAKKILSDPVTRQGYLSGWFPGITFDETKDLRIQTCLVSSHRLFSGMTLRDTPIRDIHSLSLILAENEISLSITEPNATGTIVRYSLVGEDGFSQKDLDDYLSPRSKYFKMFHQNMFAVSLFKELIPNNITLVRETFVYDMDFREWSTQMDKLGFYRLPDKQRVLKLPLTKEKLEQFLKGRNAGE